MKTKIWPWIVAALAAVGILLLLLGILASMMAREEERFQRREAMQESVRSLQRVTLAVLQYSSDHNGKLPPMQNSQIFQRAMAPYGIRNKDALISPTTEKPYLLNSALSSRALKNLQASQPIAMLYEAEPIEGPNDASELFRVVAYADRHIKAEPEKTWPAIKKFSGIP